jgi:hypothetical protein
MRVYEESLDGCRPWTGRLAKCIRDPVARLRFLKAIAPAPGRSQRRPLRRFYLPGAIVFTAVVVVIVPVLIPAASISRPRAPQRMRDTAARTRNAPERHPAPLPVVTEVRGATDVWVVEKTAESETYSNGLRIDNHFLVTTHPRSYLAFPANGNQPVRRDEPAGIVFHTTESAQAPFEASENRVLKRIGESLLEYVRRRQAYNFVLDRFGRVYRVVPEGEAANHSGNSAWADEKWFYINLNESFLGVSFEAASPAQGEAGISPAQVRSAAMLIELLRHRYRIPASNYVTHAQVSVNPSNMQVGLHLDWASGFPFEAVGLRDNYAAALPTLWAFGFDCDSNFARRAAPRMRAGIEGAEGILTRRAAAAGLRPAEYKTRLRQRYRGMLAQVRAQLSHT